MFSFGFLLLRPARPEEELKLLLLDARLFPRDDKHRPGLQPARRGGHRARGAAKVSKEGRQPHLSRDDAGRLPDQSLERDRGAHHNFPARVLLHKSSAFNRDDLEGFSESVGNNRLDNYDFISMGEASIRLFRTVEYPAIRRTLLNLDSRTHALYTRGGIDFFETCPGLYVPVAPLLFRYEGTGETPKSIARELLALTKMNWNNTQFDGREPITVRAAKQVGSILKYIPEDESHQIENRYYYYM